MVNIPRIKCLSPFKQYEMYHWGCGDGDTYNTTYNFNGGSIFGGSFGGGFWNGVGMGLGAGIASLFGFGGGGCFGGGFPMFGGGNCGLNFFGTPQLTTPTRNFFGDYYGQYRHTGDGAGGQSTTTGGTTYNGGNTTIHKSDNRDERNINKLKNKVNKFIEKHDKEKVSEKYNNTKALKQATDLYNKLPITLKDDVLTETDKDAIRKLKESLAQRFPELATRYKQEYDKEPEQLSKAQAPTSGGDQAQAENFGDKVRGCKDFNALLALIGGNKYNELNEEDKAAFDEKFDDLLKAIESNKNALNELSSKVADKQDLSSKVYAKIKALEAAEAAEEAEEAPAPTPEQQAQVQEPAPAPAQDQAQQPAQTPAQTPDATEEIKNQRVQTTCNDALAKIQMTDKGHTMSNVTLDEFKNIKQNSKISIIDTSDKIPDFIYKTVKSVDLENNTITVGVTNGTDIKYQFSKRIHDKTGALVFISNKAIQEYLLQKDNRGNIFLIQYDGMDGYDKGDLRNETKNNDSFGI